jgi:HB1/ASXL restriction endonuclease-like protein with HTH domain
MNPLRKMLDRYLAERDKLDLIIVALEKELKESNVTKSVKPSPRMAGRQKSSNSVASLAQKVLESHPSGLMLPALIGELGRLGFNSAANDVPNTINAILHRHKPPFKRLSDGRWALEKNVEKANVVANGASATH